MPDTPPPASRDKLLLYLRLARVPNVGPVLMKRALDALKTPEALLAAHPATLAAIEGIGTTRVKGFAAARSSAAIDAALEELDAATSAGVRVLCPEDPEWPPGLRTIPDPPVVLYLKGRLDPHDAVAIGVVGSRLCSYYGREQAERFGALLAGAGFCVVSGGARGIDTGAHLGALKANGRTVVVQGCGMAHVYPPENGGLYDRIVAEDRGAVLSELPLHEPPQRENFLPRNRIIAAMSLGVLVVEANLRSGSLTTARLAADDYGREVFALPGRVDSPTSAGTHHLIKTSAAHLVDSLDDILAALGDVGETLRKQATPIKARSARPDSEPAAAPAAPDAPLFASAPLPLMLTDPQQKILSAIEGEVTIDDICDRSGLPAATIMAELTLLQIRGLIARAGSNRVSRKKR